MRALVTGGKGFIGRHLCEHLEARGHVAVSYDRVDGMDVLDERTLRRFVSGSDVVFDCAGVLGSAETFAYARETINTNVVGTLCTLEACREANVPMVYLSLKTDWHNPYLITKRAANEFCLAWYENFGLPVAVVRGLNVYGPRQKWGKVRKAVPTFIMSALRGVPLVVYGDGRQVTDQIHVSDLCEVLVRTWERGVWGQEFDAGTGVPTTVNRLAHLIVDLAGSESEIAHEAMRLGEPARGSVQLADPSDMVRLLDFYPEVGLRDGLAQTIEWYREHGHEVEAVT